MKLLAIDGNSIINRAYYGIRLFSNKDGIYTNGIYGFLNILMRVEDEVKPDAVAIAFDMAAPTFRHKMYEGYKGDRKGMPEELAVQMPILQELLGYLGYVIVKKEGWEADDILGTLGAKAREGGDQCVIATGDRDSFQLVGDGVTVRLAYTKGGQPVSEFIDEEAIMEKYGVLPQQLIDVKALMGDPSDSIPGVKGIGEKTALALISEFETLDNIYANLDSENLRPAVKNKLVLGKEIAYTSRELSEIDCNVPIETALDHYIKAPVDNTKAYPLMAKLEMFSQMGRLGVAPLGDVEEEQSVEEVSLLNIHFGEIPLELYEDGKEITLLATIHEGEITALCGVDGDHLYFQEKDADQKAIEIFSSPSPKRTNNLKPLWHWALGKSISLENIAFDAEIASYILNPNSSDYSLGRLLMEYGIPTATLDDFQTERFPLLAESIGFSALCDRLSAEIKDNGQMLLLRDMELPLTQVLADMERVGVGVEPVAIEEFGVTLGETLTKLEETIYNLSGETFNINSPKQLGVILFEKLELPAKKKTKTGYSTSADVLEGLVDKHPIIKEILEYRQYAKLKSTYVDGLLAVVGDDNRIRTTFQQTLTRTGRISSTEPNLQNIPIRTPLGSQLRHYFVAQKDNILLDADYSQIELRVLAHLSGDTNMIAAFKEGLDIHQITAAQVFDMPLNMVTPLMRSRAKAVNFGIVYGIGAFSLSKDIGVSIGEARDYIEGYLEYYSGVREYMEKVIEEGTQNGYVSTMFARRRYLPELSSSNHMMKEFGKRVARNMPIQGTAADIIKIAMVRVYNAMKKAGLKAKLVLQIHDELMVEAPPEEQIQVAEILQYEMEHATTLLVPLEAEVKTGKSWFEVK